MRVLVDVSGDALACCILQRLNPDLVELDRDDQATVMQQGRADDTTDGRG